MMRDLQPSRLEQVQAALREELGEQQPKPANLAAVLAMVEPGVLVFRGRAYTVPPVPYLAGSKLQSFLLRLEGLRKEPATAEALAERDAICAECVAIFGTLARRRGPLRWLGWALPNPFRHATAEEVRQLLHFFYLSGMRSSVSAPSAKPRP